MLWFRRKRKIDPKRRYNSREFRLRVKRAESYKRPFIPLVGASQFSFRFLRYAVLALVLTAGYFLLISRYFLVTEVSIAGNQAVPAAQIEQAVVLAGNQRFLLIPKNHILLLGKGRTNQIVIDNLFFIREVVSVDRLWPNKIAIEVRERRPGFVLEVPSGKFLVDEDGLVVKASDGVETLPHVVDQTQEDVVIGEVLPNPKLTPFIISMFQAWPNKLTSNIAHIQIAKKSTQEIQFVSSEGWSVFFDVNRSAQSQLTDLAVVLARQIPLSERGRLAYVDLRLEKWVYYCYKATPCASVPAAEEGEENGQE